MFSKYYYMPYVSIDLGNKRVGLAIEVNKIPMPLITVDRVKVINELKKIIKEREITDIVVGLPYDLYGTSTKQLDKTIKFKDKLNDIFPDLNIHGEDERFTSFASDQILGSSMPTGSADRDSMSACLILESFLKRVA